VNPRRRVAQAVETASLIGSVALAAWLPWLARPGSAALVVALLCGAAVLAGSSAVAADLLSRSADVAGVGPAPSPPDADVHPRAVEVTTVVVLGDEPDALQRSSVALAGASGPCIVVARGFEDQVDADALPGVQLVRASTVVAGVRSAADLVETEAVLLLSGRAVPVFDRDGSPLLAEGAAWSIGQVEEIAADGRTDDPVGELRTALRRRAAAGGLALWEPNATTVRTEALRRSIGADDGPRGGWLRTLQHDGARGVADDRVVSAVASPAASAASWAQSSSQLAGTVADTADAVRSERGRTRLVAALLTVHELPLLTAAAWTTLLLLGVIRGELPVSMADGLLPAAVATVVVARWWGLRSSLGVVRRPVADALAAAARLPAAVGALPSVLTARVRPARRRLHERPVLWLAVGGAVIAVGLLADRAPGAVSPGVVVLAVVSLGALWWALIRMLARRGWSRATWRVPIDLPVTLGGVEGRALDGSLDGLAVAIAPDEPLSAQDALPLVIRLHGAEVSATGQVMHRRRLGDRDVVGLRVQLGDRDLPRWVAELRRHSRAAVPGSVSGLHVEDSSGAEPADRVARALERVGIAGAVCAAMALLVLLGAGMLGVHLSVVRSASMDPAIAQGSVTVSEPVAVSQLRPGDVVTRPAGGDGELPLTHRLVEVRPQDDTTQLVTRGDANTTSEIWDVGDGATVQRVRWSVPGVGTVIALARSHLVVGLWVLAAAVVLHFVVRMARPPRVSTAS
jgi:signal peptidase